MYRKLTVDSLKIESDGEFYRISFPDSSEDDMAADKINLHGDIFSVDGSVEFGGQNLKTVTLEDGGFVRIHH